MNLRMTREHTAADTASSWRDPRLWLGLALVAVSVAGANAYTHRLGQRTVALVAEHAIAAGTELGEADVRAIAVAVPAGTGVATVASDIIGLAVTHDLAAGDIIMSSAVTDYRDARTRTVSVPVRAGHLPALQHGSQVELWMTPSLQGAEAPGPARLLVDVATVVAAPEVADPTMDAAVSLLVNDSEVGDIVQAMRDGTVDVVLIGQGQ